MDLKTHLLSLLLRPLDGKYFNFPLAFSLSEFFREGQCKSCQKSREGEEDIADARA